MQLINNTLCFTEQSIDKIESINIDFVEKKKNRAFYNVTMILCAGIYRYLLEIPRFEMILSMEVRDVIKDITQGVSSTVIASLLASRMGNLNLNLNGPLSADEYGVLYTIRDTTDRKPLTKLEIEERLGYAIDIIG